MKRLNVGLWLIAGIIGSIAFWLFQVLTETGTIPDFMGQQIVSEGGYPQWMTIPIGWGVHLGVSLSYSLLFAVIMIIPFSRSQGAQVVIGAVIAALLGWVTTLLTVPAITVTISVLSRKGFPQSLPELNTTFGLPLWNHMLFFGAVWLLYLLVPYLGRKY
jgi:hypothetical protein